MDHEKAEDRGYRLYIAAMYNRGVSFSTADRIKTYAIKMAETRDHWTDDMLISSGVMRHHDCHRRNRNIRR